MQRRHWFERRNVKAVGMLQAGATQRSIAEEIGSRQNAISRLWSRYCATGDVAERQPGGKRIITQRQDRFWQVATRRQPNVTAMQLVQRLQSEHQLFFSDQIVRRRLHEAKIYAHMPLRTPALRRGNRGRRFQWTREPLL